jgi:putative sterol carrier protein
MDMRIFSTGWGNPQVPTDAKNGVKIMIGKMNPMVAMATGKLKIEGNTQGAMILPSTR